MPLQCNINSKGKLVRLINGLLVLAIGVILVFFWAGPTGGIVPWIVAATCVFAGAFMLFEARAGWCVVRAMGFRTWI